MRVLMISADPALANASSGVFARVRGYADEAGEVVAIVRTVGGSAEAVIDGALTAIPTASASRLGAIFDLVRLGCRAAREHGRFDLVTAQNPFEHGLAAWAVARWIGAPLELQAHTDFAARAFGDVSRGNRFRRRIARFLLPRAASARAVSERVAAACRAAGAKQVSVIPVRAEIGSLLNLPLPTPYAGDGTFDVVTVSRLSPEKRIGTLIEAVALLRAAGFPARLTVIGDGSEDEKLRVAAAKLEPGAVIFLGHLTSPLAAGRYHAYAQASAFEGYGLSLLEAAARALPIVTTDVGLVGEVLVDGESCLVAEDAATFASALRGLAENPNLAVALGFAARAAAARADSERTQTVVGAWRLAAPARPRRLLIVTQALDEDDPVLGFFTRWVDEMAARSDSVVAVCLRRGRYSPSANVRVLSLGKGEGDTWLLLLQKLRYVFRFKMICWRERKNYDAVFVHMNEEYVLICGVLWRLLGKKVTMWRNHYAGSWKTRLAGRLCREVYCTSKSSYTASFPNAHLMPVGVPLDRFSAIQKTPAQTQPGRAGFAPRVPRSILFLGRIAPSKNLDLAVEALGILAARGIEFRATFVGDPLPEHANYAASLRSRAAELGLSEKIEWRAGVPNVETPALYAAHEIFVNPSRSGMFDKTILEAAASGCRVVCSSEDARGLFAGAGYFPLADGAPALADALHSSLDSRDGWDATRAQLAVEANSLAALADALAARLRAGKTPAPLE